MVANRKQGSTDVPDLGASAPGSNDGHQAEADPSWVDLDPRHAIAAEMRVGGASCRAIGAELEFDRVTVWRWLQRDDVREYMEFLRDERRRDSLATMKEVTHVSLHAIGKAAARGDEKVALGWMRIASSMKPMPL